MALCLSAWLLPSRPAAGQTEPQPAPSSKDDKGSGSSFKGKIHSAFSDDQNDEDQDHERLHWGPIYPSLAVVSSGASVGPKLQFWKRDLGGSELDFHASAAYSIRRYQHYAARFGLLPERTGRPPSFYTGSERLFPLSDLEKLSGVENHFVLYGGYRFRDFPEEDFYGVGFDTLKGDRGDFRLHDHLFEVVTAYHFSPRVAVTAKAGWLDTSLRQGRDDRVADLPARFSDATAPGLSGTPQELMFTGGVLVDLRDEPGNPHGGMLFLASLTRFEERRGRPFEFTRAASDLRVYLPLFSPRHVIATRGLVSVDWPDAGNRVPFYLQSSLGGTRVLRGYPSFRFRDDALVAFSAEYRFEPIADKLELALFYDAGQVAPHESQLRFSDFRSAWGAGIRIKSAEKLRLRFDVAKSREATRYLVKLSPSF
jgi:hypothetical protein